MKPGLHRTVMDIQRAESLLLRIITPEGGGAFSIIYVSAPRCFTVVLPVAGRMLEGRGQSLLEALYALSHSAVSAGLSLPEPGDESSAPNSPP